MSYVLIVVLNVVMLNVVMINVVVIIVVVLNVVALIVVELNVIALIAVVLRVGNSNEMPETFCFDERIMEVAIDQKSHDFQVKFFLNVTVRIVFNRRTLLLLVLLKSFTDGSFC